mmetsp:Transcript_9327/g.16847  ORF Transcript_9327/g.16847 Transcript_9327/m.16847 type:complete len:154 (-) Transcript_9327:182-643(-)
MSRSRSPGDKRARLREQIERFVDTHKLDDKVCRIMSNMHPADVRRVMDAAFPQDVRNPSGFIISAIRKVEKESDRPQGYRWDGRSWSEPPRGRRRESSRSRDRGRGRGRSDSRSRSRRGGGGRGGRRSRSPSGKRNKGKTRKGKRDDSSESSR